MSFVKGADASKSYENRALLTCLEVGKLLISNLDLKEILRLIMTKVTEVIEAENWSLLLEDETTGGLRFEIAVGIDREKINGFKLKPGEGAAGHAAETGTLLIVPDVHGDPRFSPRVDQLTGFTTHSLVCVPLRFQDEVLGVIEIVNIKDFVEFESKVLPVLTILADYAAIAIEHSRLFDRIRRMSITDEYTGLYNARYLHQILGGLVNEARSGSRSLAVVFVDVDHFKRIVDTRGHPAGSLVLKEIGQTIQSCLSEDDLLIKYGGDEYVLLLPGRNRDSAWGLVRRVQEAIRASKYLLSDPEPVSVTASFGIALCPDDARNEKDLLILADQMMYSIKRTTKDGIGIHPR